MNQVAVVIGGGQTLGAYLSEGLANAGYRVAVADLNIDNANKIAAAINEQHGAGRALGFRVDATDEESVIALARQVDEHLGRADLLLYSAGIARAAPITEFGLRDFDLSLQVNLVGYFLCAREFSKLMIRDGIKAGLFRLTQNPAKSAVNITPVTARPSLVASASRSRWRLTLQNMVLPFIPDAGQPS